MLQEKSLLLLVLFLVFILASGPVFEEAAGREVPIECSSNASGSLVYGRMVEQNEFPGEHYKQVRLESRGNVPQEVQTPVYNTMASQNREYDISGASPPPGKQSAIAVSSPGDSGEAGYVVLFGIGVLALLAAAWLIRQRVRKKEE
jgi:hypothetical protein